MLIVRGVHKKFREISALQNINLELSTGITALLGANGSGKSTLLRILATLDTPSSGDIFWRKYRYPSNIALMRANIGYLPQELLLPSHLTAYQLLIYLGKMRLLSEQAIKHTIEQFRLNQIAHHPLEKLSNGQLRLIALAQAILSRPPLMFLDELTNGLDAIERERVFTILAQHHATILFSTHLPQEAERFAQRVIVLYQGQVLYHGSISALCKRAENQCFEMTLPSAERQQWLQKFHISRATENADAITLRILNSTRPHPEAKSVSPTLEDAYLLLVSAQS